MDTSKNILSDDTFETEEEYEENMKVSNNEVSIDDIGFKAEKVSPILNDFSSFYTIINNQNKNI